MTTKAEAITADRIAMGYERPPDGTMGHGQKARWQPTPSYYVHLVKWWKAPEKNYWGEGSAIWLCGNQSPHSTLVTEIPEGMAMCHQCEKKASR